MVLLAFTVAACSGAGMDVPVNDGNLTICHATGNTATPYDEITLNFNDLASHADHVDDLVPAPATGCPDVVETGNNTGKLTICHATGSATNPYTEIMIDFNGLSGHGKHENDVVPAPEGGCPSVTVTPPFSGTTTVTPTPTVTGTSTVTTTPGNAGKITICHATGSAKKPYVMITVSVNGLNGHGNHPGDIIPAPAGGCPTK